MFQRLMKEPLLHFLILGGILFAVATSVASRQSAAREVAIDKAQQSRLAAIYRTQTGKDPDAQEMNQLVEQFVHDEVLSREATALGLDGNDEIIRRRLVQKMTFLMEDNGANAEPDDAALHRYYQEHPQAFQDAERVWFRHCYFATDQRGADGARNAAAKLGDALNAARRDPLPGESDSFPLQSEFSGMAQGEAVKQFGDSAFSKALFTVAPGSWSGPAQSGYGWHLIFVAKRQPPALPPFETVRDQVRTEYQRTETAHRNEVRFAEIARKYRIRREGQ